MKRMIVDKIKNDFGVKKIAGRKIESYDFYTLCGFYKSLKAGKELK